MILLLNPIEWGTVAVVLYLSGTLDVKNCWWNEIYQLAWEYWSNTDMELHDAEEAIGMRKILAYDMRMKKNPQTKEGTFWIFMELCRSKVQLVPPHGNSINWNRLYAATFSNNLHWLIYFFFKKKALTLIENLLNFNGTYVDRKQPFERFLKMDARSSFLRVNAFLPIWILFALDFLSIGYCNRKF